MRLAPVPMFFYNEPEEAIEKSAESSRTTHGAPACLDACRYLAALLIGALSGSSKKEILSSRYTPVPGFWDRRPLISEIDEIACGSFKRKKPSGDPRNWICGPFPRSRPLELLQNRQL